MSTRTLRCSELIKRINDIIEKNANNILNKEDITISQLKMLFVLIETPDGSATLKELEKYFGVAQSTVAGIASRLERKQLVSPYTDPVDKRIKHIRIADEGRELCSRARRSIEEVEDRILGILTSEERCRLREMLQKMYISIK